MPRAADDRVAIFGDRSTRTLLFSGGKGFIGAILAARVVGYGSRCLHPSCRGQRERLEVAELTAPEPAGALFLFLGHAVFIMLS